MYAYNRFWLRFANLEFSLSELDVYEKHFTVMNYTDTNLKQMFCTGIPLPLKKHVPPEKGNLHNMAIFTFSFPFQ